MRKSRNNARNKLYKRRSLRKTFKGGMNPLHSRGKVNLHNRKAEGERRQSELEELLAEGERRLAEEEKQRKIERMKNKIESGIIKKNPEIMTKILDLANLFKGLENGEKVNKFINMVTNPEYIFLSDKAKEDIMMLINNDNELIDFFTFFFLIGEEPELYGLNN